MGNKYWCKPGGGGYYFLEKEEVGHGFRPGIRIRSDQLMECFCSEDDIDATLQEAK
jgi:hypothetical protein